VPISPWRTKLQSQHDSTTRIRRTGLYPSPPSRFHLDMRGHSWDGISDVTEMNINAHDAHEWVSTMWLQGVPVMFRIVHRHRWALSCAWPWEVSFGPLA
jgi:hypothetical protein